MTLNTDNVRFAIHAIDGRRIYKNLRRDDEISGYSWGDGYGFITDDQIARERWAVSWSVGA